MLKELDDLIESGAIHTVFVGKSAVPGMKRFATLRTGAAETVSDGKGNSVAEALTDALSKLNGASARPLVTQPAMPGFTQPSMPGFTR
jgi:hypothetical protein